METLPSKKQTMLTLPIDNCVMERGLAYAQWMRTGMYFGPLAMVEAM